MCNWPPLGVIILDQLRVRNRRKIIITLSEEDGFDHIYVDGSLHNYDFFMMRYGKIGISDGTLIEYNPSWPHRMKVIKKGEAFMNTIQKNEKTAPVFVIDEDRICWVIAGEGDCH